MNTKKIIGWIQIVLSIIIIFISFNVGTGLDGAKEAFAIEALIVWVLLVGIIIGILFLLQGIVNISKIT